MSLFDNSDPIIGIGTYESTSEEFDPEWYHGIPAFFYFESTVFDDVESLYFVNDCPTSLADVVGMIISIFNKGEEYLNEDLLPQLKENFFKEKKISIKLF